MYSDSIHLTVAPCQVLNPRPLRNGKHPLPVLYFGRVFGRLPSILWLRNRTQRNFGLQGLSKMQTNQDIDQFYFWLFPHTRLQELLLLNLDFFSTNTAPKAYVHYLPIVSNRTFLANLAKFSNPDVLVLNWCFLIITIISKEYLKLKKSIT
jgi:hypothetical protein